MQKDIQSTLISLPTPMSQKHLLKKILAVTMTPATRKMEEKAVEVQEAEVQVILEMVEVVAVPRKKLPWPATQGER